MTKAVAIVSGGMDSITMLHQMMESITENIHMLSFDYGQKHVKELEFASYWSDEFGLKHDIIDLTNISHLLTSSSLVGDAPVPEGHYAADNMKSTVVPNRNMMMLSIATAVAVNDKAECVGIGVHAGDHFVYPDCRPEFINDFSKLAQVANDGFIEEGFGIFAPFLNMSKAEIVTEGQELGVDFTKTWSCYKGEDVHCSLCGTCVERIEAFKLAQIDDPTTYALTL